MKSVHRVLLLSLLSACIGRPVVDEKPVGPKKIDGLCEDDELNCSDWGGPQAFPGIDATAFEPPPPCSDEAWEMRIDEADQPAVGWPLQLHNIDASCTTFTLTLGMNVGEVVLVQPILHHARVHVLSEGEALLTISAAVGEGVSLTLEGTSTLRLRSIEHVNRLQVDALTATRGWDIEIASSSLHGAALRTGPDGTMLLDDSTRIETSQLQTGTLSLQGVAVDRSVIDVREVNAVSTDMFRNHLYTRRGSFGAGLLDEVTVYGCESLLFGMTTVEESDIGPCSTGLDLGSGAFVRESILRGNVRAVQAQVSHSIIGAEIGATLSLFDSRVGGSLLCDLAALSGRGNTTIRCARCDPGSPVAVCLDESTAVSVVACPEVAAATQCDVELPPTLVPSTDD
jgi:hypothetical protein